MYMYKNGRRQGDILYRCIMQQWNLLMEDSTGSIEKVSSFHTEMYLGIYPMCVLVWEVPATVHVPSYIAIILLAISYWVSLTSGERRALCAYRSTRGK